MLSICHRRYAKELKSLVAWSAYKDKNEGSAPMSVSMTKKEVFIVSSNF